MSCPRCGGTYSCACSDWEVRQWTEEYEPRNCAAALRGALDAMLIWFDGEPCYRSLNGLPMEMPDKVRREVKRRLRPLAVKPGKVVGG